MEEKKFDEILLLDENNKIDFQSCYNYLKEYIENVKKSDFNNDSVINLKALIDKFLQFASPIETSSAKLFMDLLECTDSLEHTCYKHSFSEGVESEVTRNLIYQNLYSNFLKVYNKASLYFRNNKEELLEFDGLIDYTISNKKRAISIIYEAIELIENDLSLSEKSKNQILEYLSDTVQELINPKTSWKRFFIKTTEVIIVLGTLGSIVGGVEAGINLLKAKEKVESAKNEIVNTSINLNFMNVEKTFNFNKQIEIENNKILVLEENNKK